MSTINKVTLVLENCEFLTFVHPEVFILDIEGISERFSSYTNVICKTKCAKSLIIGLDKNAKGIDHNLFSGTTWQERLKLKDVTQVVIEYNDSTEETIYLDWPQGYQYSHPSQEFLEANKYIIFSSNNEGVNVMDYLTLYHMSRR